MPTNQRQTADELGAQPVARRPWELGRPSPLVTALEESGLIHDPVLDAACGSGENALYLARCGHRVTAIDPSPSAVARAASRAREQGLDIDFCEADPRELAAFTGRFETVIDTGLLHVLSPLDRARYVESLRLACRLGGTLFLFCLSDRNVFGSAAAPVGTGAVSESELREAFSYGWLFEGLQARTVDVSVPNRGTRSTHYWVARLHRM